jgi:hypothetical protein
LISEWNRLLEGLTREKEMANNMKEIINGNVPTKETRREKPRIKEEHSESEIRLMKGFSEDNHDDKRLSFQNNNGRKMTPLAH